MNTRVCRRHCWVDGLDHCVLCGMWEHYGLTAMGLWLRCIQDVHFCWGQEDGWELERGKIGAGQC